MLSVFHLDRQIHMVILTLSMLGKKIQQRTFFIFLRKQVLTFNANCLFADNLHKLSDPIFLGKVRKISPICW